MTYSRWPTPVTRIDSSAPGQVWDKFAIPDRKKGIDKVIDEQVRLVRLQTDNFHLFHRKQTEYEKPPFTRWANGKRIKEITWPSVFHLKWQHINIQKYINKYIFMLPFQYLYIYSTQKVELVENGNLRLFSAKKRKFIFLGRQMINGNRCSLFQQTCPSMDKVGTPYWSKPLRHPNWFSVRFQLPKEIYYDLIHLPSTTPTINSTYHQQRLPLARAPNQCRGFRSGIRAFLPDPNLALVMYIYQVIVSKKMFLTNFLKNCHDVDTM